MSAASRQTIIAELQAKGVDPEVCEYLARGMSGGWRDTAAPVDPTYQTALASLHLSGYPHLAGRPIQFSVETASMAAAASATISLSPRIPVLIVGAVFEEPITAAALGDLNTTAQTYSGNAMYPDGGKSSTSFVRTKDVAAFTNEALRSNANPFPEPLLVSDDLTLDWTVKNNHATVAAVLRGTFFGITLKNGHRDYAGLAALYAGRN